MSIDDALQKIERTINYINSGEILRDGEVAGLDLAALITDRVVKTGKSKDGQPFTPYSKKEIKAGGFLGKSRNAAAELKVKAAAKARQNLSYRDFRGLNNLNADKKNFEFTGNMWRGFTVTGVSFSGRVLTIRLGGNTSESSRKIAWNNAQERKDITDPSIVEIKIISDILKKRMSDKLK